jgi:chemotaxis receptor (MCP) glutamine deamidase CheD
MIRSDSALAVVNRGYTHVIDTLKKLLARPTNLEKAATELSEARLELLAAQTAVDYARSVVAYNETRIARLEEYLFGEAK